MAFGPVPPLTIVRGASLLPMAIPVEPPDTTMPVASPDVRATPWRLTPAIEELATPLKETGGADAEPNMVVTWPAPKSLKFWAHPPVMFMSGATESVSL